MRVRAGAVAAALALVAAVAAAGGARSGQPAPLLLGAVVPLAGAPGDAAVARGAEAYFRHVDARGRVHGRPVSFRVLDAASAADAVQATRELVERHGVLAVVASAGTEENLAVRDYLNRVRVPQLFVGSGVSAWARLPARYPWSIGYRPALALEGEILGRYLVAARPGARVGVLAEAGADGGELVAGLRRGVSGSQARVAAVVHHDPAAADVRAEVARLRASGVDALALLVSADAAAEAAAVARRLAWRPAVVGALGAAVEGSVAVSFVKDPTDPRWAADPGMRLYRRILARYAPGADARDAGHVHGMAVAHTTVEVLHAAGPDPSRAELMARARSLRSASNPFLLPGISVRTSAADAAPIEQAMLQRRVRGSWRSFGGLWR